MTDDAAAPIPPVPAPAPTPAPAPGRDGRARATAVARPRLGPWIGAVAGALVIGIAIGALGAARLSAVDPVADAGAGASATPTPSSASATPATSATPTQTPGAAGPARSTAAGFLATDGARIVDSTGATVILKAVNWFGLETNNCAPHGLWSRSLDEILDQIHGFGFTTIRLPWSNQCLDGAAPNSIDENKNPELKGKSAVEIIDAVVAGAKARGMTVLLDRHRPGYDQQSELWYTDAYPEQRWIDDWVMLATRYRDEPTVIGADLHNEPHGPACWACGDAARDWAAAATRAGDAILAVQPSWLIVVEGVERMGDGTSTWWGGGLSDVRAHPITLNLPDRLVYSTHEYPASVYAQTWFSAPTYPDNLRPLWDKNWGYLAVDGIAPVFVGEFGTRAETDSDRTWLAHLVAYLHDDGLSFGYWSYNPNSGDTGGLVQDDWVTPQQAKLDAIAPLLG